MARVAVRQARKKKIGKAKPEHKEHASRIAAAQEALWQAIIAGSDAGMSARAISEAQRAAPSVRAEQKKLNNKIARQQMLAQVGNGYGDSWLPQLGGAHLMETTVAGADDEDEDDEVDEVDSDGDNE